MPSRRRGPIPSDIGDLVEELDDLQSRLQLLEAPAGEALSSTVSKLTNLVTNIQAQLDTWTSTRYTNTAIDTLIAGRAPLSHTHSQSDVLGVWTKGVNTSDGITAQGAIFFPNVYATDLTGTRRTGWVQSDGRMGYASSSERSKTRIRRADEERLLRILDAEPRSFMYRKEIARRTSERINNGVDYRPAIEIGLLAEELDRLGLGEFVYYDEAGCSEGIEYSMLVLPLLAVARNLDARLRTLEGDAV